LPKPERHILVGVPLVGYWLTSGISQFAFALGQTNANDMGVRFTYKPINGSSVISFNVEFMRNTLVKMALDDPTVTDLWFVDSDVMPSPNSMDLLHVEGDIVGGIYPIPNKPLAKVGTPPVWSVYHRMDNAFAPATLPDEPTLMEAGALGTGAMIIKRHVLEDKKMRHAEDDHGLPCIFRTPRSPSGFCLATDDLDFCRRAVDAGYRIVAHTGVRFGHIKTHDVATMDAGYKAARL
jgi:hypothetical protein